MKSCTLTRHISGDQGTPGLLVSDGLALHSLELPWRDDAPSLSCIKAGTYDAEWDYSPHLDRYCYHLIDAETGRTGIRIHSGNFAGDKTKGWQADVEGCILLGMSAGEMENREGKLQQCVLESHIALERFNEWAARDRIRITIVDPTP